jgi:nucleoside-diphosphate-sugar epimerase
MEWAGGAGKNGKVTEARGAVLVTGGAGYIGSILMLRLLYRGHRVRVLDRLLDGDRAISDLYGNPRVEMIVGDFRDRAVVARAVRGVDAVLHLGAIVGDPACAIDEDFTIRTNLDATRLLAEACKRHGVRRLVFASTCSVYGASDDMLDESSALNPVSLYANTKIAAERALLGMRGADFAPVILRFATAYGHSYRPRFDLVVNLLTAKAVTEGQITIHGGEQWRPFVHVDDIARACILAMAAADSRVAGETFNVGSQEQNHRLRELGAIIQRLAPRATVVTYDLVTDKRNYCVRFDKIKHTLGFTPVHTLAESVREMQTALESGAVANWKDRYHNNHQYLSQVIPAAAVEPGQGKIIPLRPRLAMDRTAAIAVGAD